MTSTPLSTDRAARRYSTVAIVLHWLIGVLLLFEVGLGLRMEDAHGPARFASFQLHKSIGITILMLVALRVVWRLRRTPPTPAHSGWQGALAKAVHALFYVLLFALPFSGWLIVSSSRVVVPTLLYGAIPWPHLPWFAAMAVPARDAWHGFGTFVHHSGVKLIYALFALHLAGVVKHQFIDRDDDLARMAPGVAPGAWRDPRVIAIVVGAVVAVGLGLQWLPIGGAVAPATLVATIPPALPAPVPAPSPAAENSSDAVANEAQPVQTASADWKIKAGSTLRFATTWSGDAINGTFGTFDGDITFDPDNLDSAHVEIRIPLASVATGDAQRDETLKSEDWFSATAFGTALFRADRFRRLGSDRYIASGTLRIKGVTLPASLSFTVTIDGDKADMHGTASVDRTAYKIGVGDYAGTSEIPAAVKVDVAIRATRMK